MTMARTSIISESHTVRDHGNSLCFNATRIEIPTSGGRISITADRTDRSWDILNYDDRVKALKDVIRKAAQERGWRPYFPEISTQQVIIGFHDTIAVDDAISFIEVIGFTQNPPTTRRVAPKKLTRRN